jgi:hypothetical protein
MTVPETPSAGHDELSRANRSLRGTSEISEPAGFVDPKTIGLHDDGTVALLVRVQVPDQPGVLHALTSVIFKHRANITYVDIADQRQRRNTTYFELNEVNGLDALVADLESLPIVRSVEREPSFGRIYGKRIIVIGGGAQVGQVVLGAVSEADRHNIRGERISVDTIPWWGKTSWPGRSEPSPGCRARWRW